MTHPTSKEPDDEERAKIDEYLKSIYYDPQNEASFSSPDSLFKYVKKHKKFSLTRAQINEWLKWQDVYTTHVAKRKPKHTSPVVVPYLRYQYDIDSGVLPSSHKKGLKYFILAIDVFSRKIAARGVRDLKARSARNALHEIFTELDTPEHIRTDQGGEYVNQAVKALTDEMGVKHFIAYPPNKANYAERGIKTIKKLLFKQMESKGKKNWDEQMLQDTVDGYNARPHSATGMPPIKVTDKDVPALWFKQQDEIMDNSPPPSKFKFEINDPVRVEIMKQSFAKDYEKSFSNQVYYIRERYAPYNVQRYKVKTYLNEAVKGSYLSSELQKVHIDENTQYKIEKILSRRVKKGVEQVKVRWAGYDARYDSWIDRAEVSKLSEENNE